MPRAFSNSRRAPSLIHFRVRRPDSSSRSVCICQRWGFWLRVCRIPAVGGGDCFVLSLPSKRIAKERRISPTFWWPSINELLVAKKARKCFKLMCNFICCCGILSSFTQLPIKQLFLLQKTKASTHRRKQNQTAKFPLNSEPKPKCGSLKQRSVLPGPARRRELGLKYPKFPEGFQHSISFFRFIILFYFLAVAGLCCCSGAFSSVSGPVLLSLWSIGSRFEGSVAPLCGIFPGLNLQCKTDSSALDHQRNPQ